MGLKLISPGGGSVTLDVPSMANTYTLMLPTSNSGSILTTAVYPAAPGTSGNVMTSNGTAFVSQALVVTPIPTMNVFTSNGTFTIPAGVTKVKVTVVGGGGAGGGTQASTYFGGGGGGGGGTAIKVLTGLTPGATLNVIVGSGTPGSAGSTTQAQGGTSNVYSSATQSITPVSANGGFSGAAFGSPTIGPSGINYWLGGLGGHGANGDVNIRGTPGQYGYNNNDTNPGIGGAGGSTIFGAGAATLVGSGAGSAATGNGFGGGGSGATQPGGGGPYAGGTGAAGVVIFEY